MLRRTGGIAVYLKTGIIRTVRTSGDAHPWMKTVARSPSQGRDQLYRRNSPASLP
ncbi:hypothetical protein BH10PSE12_BH10PSE12_00450 [soil metagenome]